MNADQSFMSFAVTFVKLQNALVKPWGLCWVQQQIFCETGERGMLLVLNVFLQCSDWLDGSLKLNVTLCSVLLFLVPFVMVIFRHTWTKIRIAGISF